MAAEGVRLDLGKEAHSGAANLLRVTALQAELTTAALAAAAPG